MEVVVYNHNSSKNKIMEEEEEVGVIGIHFLDRPKLQLRMILGLVLELTKITLSKLIIILLP